jgi:hypothetical protein
MRLARSWRWWDYTEFSSGSCLQIGCFVFSWRWSPCVTLFEEDEAVPDGRLLEVQPSPKLKAFYSLSGLESRHAPVPEPE